MDEFIEKLRDRLQSAANETEVRDRFCGEIHNEFGIEFRLERDRNDARLNRVVLEFKTKGAFRGIMLPRTWTAC